MALSTQSRTPVIAAAQVDDLPGYADLTPLGTSGAVTTYRGRRDNGDPVAVKVFGGDADTAAIRKALNRYWLAGQQLKDMPGLLDVVDAGSTFAGRRYVVTPYCELGSLADRLDTKGALAMGEVLNIAVPIALAPHGAHQVGLVHRGVKPSNILLSDDGQPVLADFVSAGLRAGELQPEPGAALYAAPELLAGADATPRSDVYSLAATVVHLLTGREPAAGGPVRLDLGVIEQAARSTKAAHAARPLYAALVRALAEEPALRTPDALAFAEELHGVLIDLELSAPSTPPIDPPPPEIPELPDPPIAVAAARELARPCSAVTLDPPTPDDADEPAPAASPAVRSRRPDARRRILGIVMVVTAALAMAAVIAIRCGVFAIG